MQMQRGRHADASRTAGKSSTSSRAYEKTISYTNKSGRLGSATLEEIRNSYSMNGNAKAYSDYQKSNGNAAYDSNYSSSQVSPAPAYHSYATTTKSAINGDVSPTATTKRITVARLTADESRRLHEANADSSTYFQSDAEATNEMIRLNDILSDYKMEVLVLDGNNRRLTEELTRLQKPLEAFARLEIAMQESDRQLLTDFAKYKSEVEELKAKYVIAENARHEQITKIDGLMKRIADLDGEIRHLRAQKNELDERYQRALADNEHLSADLTRVRRDLEVERQARARFEAQVQHMAVEAHEYALVMKKLKEEVTAFAKMPRAEIIQADLTQQVEQIRRDYERSRDRLKENFDVRINEFYGLLMSENKQTDKLRHEVAELRAYRDRVYGVEKENAGLNARIAALERDLSVANHQYALMKDQHSTENVRWTDMKKILENEQSAFNNKSKLYGEVVIYRDILEGKPHFEDGMAMVTKTEKERTHKYRDRLAGYTRGKIAFTEIDLAGRFITLKNVTKHDVNITNWLIKQVMGGHYMIKFHIPNGVIIAPGKKLKIWANGQGESDYLPYQIVFKQENSWGTGNVQTFLFDDREKEHASFTRTHTSSKEQEIVV